MKYSYVDELKSIIETLKNLDIDEADIKVGFDSINNSIDLLVPCNNFFVNEGKDSERITLPNIGTLQQSIQDVRALGLTVEDGLLLFCARQRRSRPHPSVYKFITADLHPLFDKCGSVRFDYDWEQLEDLGDQLPPRSDYKPDYKYTPLPPFPNYSHLPLWKRVIGNVLETLDGLLEKAEYFLDSMKK